jgi:hypothetical protein
MVNRSTTGRLEVCNRQCGTEVRSSHCHGFVTKLAPNTDGES